MSTRASAELQTQSGGLARATEAAWSWFSAREATVLLLVVGLGAVLRLATLGYQSLWLDEGLSYWIANRPLNSLIAYLTQHDTHPPLHYLLLQPMIGLGGSEWLLRLPSALAGIVAIPLMYALGRELFGGVTGLVAATLLAVSPLHIWHSQEARMYSLVAMLTLAATLFAVRAVRGGRWLDWAGLVVCQAFALWSNTAAIWFTLALNAAALLVVGMLWRRGRFWPWVVSQALAVGLWLPWTPILLQQIRVSGDNNRWISPATIQQVLLTLAAFVSQSEGRPLQLAALVLLAVVMLLGGMALLRDARHQRSVYTLLACLIVVPIGLAFLVSQPYVAIPGVSALLRQGASIFLTRNLIIASLPLLLVLARALVLAAEAGGWRRWASVGLLTMVMVTNVVTMVDALLFPNREDWRSSAVLVAAEADGSDLIVFVPPYIEGPFVYYFRRFGGANEIRGYPHDDWAVHPVKQSYAVPAAVLAGHQRYWIITSGLHDTIDGPFMAELETAGRVLKEEHARGITMRLFERRAGSP